MTELDRKELARKLRSLFDAIQGRNQGKLKDFGILLYGGEVLTLQDVTNLIQILEAP